MPEEHTQLSIPSWIVNSGLKTKEVALLTIIYTKGADLDLKNDIGLDDARNVLIELIKSKYVNLSVPENKPATENETA